MHRAPKVQNESRRLCPLLVPHQVVYILKKILLLFLVFKRNLILSYDINIFSFIVYLNECHSKSFCGFNDTENVHQVQHNGKKTAISLDI